MLIERIPAGKYSANCYVVADDTTGQAAVIDPGGDVDDIMEFLRQRQLKLVAIINTHGHFDHIGGNAKLRASTGAPLMIHADDAELLEDSRLNLSQMVGDRLEGPAADRQLHDGDEIVVGALKLNVIHTPGHTRGCICLRCGDHLFSGDTLFVGSIGRTDLYGGDSDAIRRSLREKLLPLPDELAVHPGHGPDTVLGDEKAANPYLR
ncbi:MAG: MBL fold metallo-hydrolase [Chloroflexota bacterium]